MIKRVVKKGSLDDSFRKKTNSAYWLTKSVKERIEAVEMLRRQYDGNTARLQRVVRVIQREQR